MPIAKKDNRKELESFDETSTIFTHIKRLNELRANYSALRVGNQREMWEVQQVYASSRRDDGTGKETITISNRAVRQPGTHHPADLPAP